MAARAARVRWRRADVRPQRDACNHGRAGRDAEQLDHFIEADRRWNRLWRTIEQVGSHREVGKKAGLLEDVTDSALMRLPKEDVILPDLAIDCAEAVGEAMKAGDATRHSRLAATGWAVNRGYTPRRCAETCIEQKASELTAEGDVNPRVFNPGHAVALAPRLSISVIVKITANAKITMPPASKLASRHREAST